MDPSGLHDPPPPQWTGSPPRASNDDWLINPFSGASARTKMRAWVLRTARQWMRGVIPEGEERRLTGPPVHVQQRRRAGARARGSRPMPQKGTEKRRSSENVMSTNKAALLWMYCREIAPFETSTFSDKVGELIARATSTPSEMRKPISGSDRPSRLGRRSSVSGLSHEIEQC